MFIKRKEKGSFLSRVEFRAFVFLGDLVWKRINIFIGIIFKCGYLGIFGRFLIIFRKGKGWW